MKKIILNFLSIALAVAALNVSRAQTEIQVGKEISIPGHTKPIPVSLEGFTGEVAEVLRFDLYVQGFSFTNADGAQYLITGKNTDNVQGGVADRFTKQPLFTPRIYTGASMRKQAHAFADDIVFAITGRKGIAQTKIAFKQQSPGGNGEIFVSDFDGGNPLAITHDGTIVSSPTWVSSRMALCYNSYLRDNPDIFYHDLATGQRRVIARYGGSSISPAVSPDGSKVAMILSKGGSPNVYVANVDGSDLKQLTTGVEDSSPCWSPNGEWICFATKINERRALAKVPSSGGTVQRISTAGVSNPTEPDWSPDGKWIAFTSQMGDFNLCVVPADGGTVTVLVTGEDPSWSANSRTLVFNRRVNNRNVLSVLDVFTKQAKDIARISGSNSEPAWQR